MPLFISFGFVLLLLVLQKRFTKIKPLGIASVISFLHVFTCVTIAKFFHVSSLWLHDIALAPGVVIGLTIAILNGASSQSAFHSTEWTIVMHVSSFMFYTGLLFGVFKGVAYLKKKWSKHKNRQNNVNVTLE